MTEGYTTHAKCGTEIPNEALIYDLEGERCKVRGRCPACKTYGHISTVELTDDQYAAAYHDILPLRRFQIVKYINHRIWDAREVVE